MSHAVANCKTEYQNKSQLTESPRMSCVSSCPKIVICTASSGAFVIKDVYNKTLGKKINVRNEYVAKVSHEVECAYNGLKGLRNYISCITAE